MFEELIPGGYPATPQHENAENNAENNNTTVDKTAENQAKNDIKDNDIENKTAENDVEKKAENKDLEIKENKDPENKENEDSENKENEVAENKENEASDNKENEDSENKKNRELKDKENIAKSFPLKFEPNSSMKPADDNNVAKATTNKGSSALGGIGLNPATMLGIGSDSPPHPFYQDKSQKSDEPKTFDLSGDYNEQKEKEQLADQQEQQKPKDERIDLGIKPLGNQPLPSPYKPESEGADRSVHKQTEGKGETTPGKTTAVHPESQNVGPRITKKDKINATIGKAVGIFKQKIGKLVKNDNLVEKGTEKKSEAEKTKELAEVQQKMNEL